MGITHAKVSGIANNGAEPTKVGGADWDAAHVITGLSTAGTGFPGGPADGDRFFRTDRGLEYYWDGTRWLSTTLYAQDIPPYLQASTHQPFTPAVYVTHRGAPPADLYDLWIIDFRITIRVNSTNNGSNYWTLNLSNYPAGTVLSTLNTSAKSPDTIYGMVATVGALWGTTNPLLQVQTAVTGTPGNVDVFTAAWSYRLVG